MSEYNLQLYMEFQRPEIEEHKYYLSEKHNRDVGYHFAILDWIESGEAERFNQRYLAHLKEAEILAAEFEGRQIPLNLIHKVLED